MTNSQTKERLRVLHVISGDLWAGAEAQAYTLLKHLKPLCDVSAVLMNEGQLARKLRSCDIPVLVLDESSFSSWQILVALRKHMKVLKPDVVHTHRIKENILGALANATSIKAKCIRTVHGAPEFTPNLKSRILNQIDIAVGNRFQDISIAVSDELNQKLKWQLRNTRISTIYNGIDAEELEKYAVIADFKRNEPNKKHIGIIGRLVPVKRVDRFLEAAALLHNEFGENYFQFHVIGNGPLREALESKSSGLGISNYVKFHGHRNDIPSCILSLDAVVICSDHEGLPMTSLEALALKTPLVVTDNLQFKTLIYPNHKRNHAAASPKYIADQILESRTPIAELNKQFLASTCAQKTHSLYVS